MYGCESWTIKKSEHQRIDAFEPWSWRLLEVSWTARRWNQSILKEISLEYSLAGLISSVQFSSVTQPCPTLCDPMDCSTPGLPVHHQLPEFTQIHVHWVGDAISTSVVPFSCLLSLPPSGSFLMNWLFASGGQSIGASASALVFPINIQDWFPLGWTSWISLQPQGLSRVFSNTTVQKHQFFGAQTSL